MWICVPPVNREVFMYSQTWFESKCWVFLYKHSVNLCSVSSSRFTYDDLQEKIKEKVTQVNICCDLSKTKIVFCETGKLKLKLKMCDPVKKHMKHVFLSTDSERISVYLKPYYSLILKTTCTCPVSLWKWPYMILFWDFSSMLCGVRVPWGGPTGNCTLMLLYSRFINYWQWVISNE